MVVVVDTISATPLRPRHPEKVNRPDAFSPPKPDWIRVHAPNTRGYADTRKIVKENGLVTVCEEAGCPNIGECWDKKHATFMIMGDTCTRACAFCNVKTGMPSALDAGAGPCRGGHFKLGLAHIVITSVDRDDLADGGAEHFAQISAPSARAARPRPSKCWRRISCARTARSRRVITTRPEVFNHNLETVPSRLLTSDRMRAVPFPAPVGTDRGFDPTSSPSRGSSSARESRQEMMQVMDSLAAAEVDFLTIGQYLQPNHNIHTSDALCAAGRVHDL